MDYAIPARTPDLELIYKENEQIVGRSLVFK